MKTRFLFVVMLLATLVLAACAPKAAETYALPMEVLATEAPPVAEYEEPAPTEPPVVPEAESGGVTYDIDATSPDIPSYQRMVIKNAEITLLVKDSDIALNSVTQLVGDVRGYIVSSQVWYQDYYGTNFKYARLTIGVPSDQFEVVLRRLRGLAIRVLNESASGEDVTDQYVDLQAQLSNLEATRDRIKSFLDQAKTVDEALKINQQLSDVEAQIEQIKGKMNYLADRAAFSTVTITIEPDLPPVTPTVTPTPQPTATPLPTATPTPWEPSKTFERSSKTLTTAYRGIAEFLIWLFVVLVPILLPFILIGWLAWWIIRRAIHRK